MDAYQSALERHISPDSVVLDLGTGIGLIAICACKAGAKKVYAIEANDTIAIAQDLALENSCEDRIEFIQGFSTDIELPERVDVIVSDLRGVLPLYGRHIPTLIDARQRFLKQGGQLFPFKDELCLALVSDAELFERKVEPWAAEPYGLSLKRLRALSGNCWYRASIPAESIVSDSQQWATIEYQSIESGDVSGDASLSVARPALVHGFALWFNASIAEGIGFSCAPDQPRENPVYGCSFFPFQEPQQMGPTDTAQIHLKAKLVGDTYVWNWQSEFMGPSFKESNCRFSQSTFFASYMPPLGLEKRADSYLPQLSERGRIDAFILSQMRASLSIAEIAKQLQDSFPGRFEEYRDALAYVGNLSEQYSE